MREEQTAVELYEPPALVELGQFSDDTLGGVPGLRYDWPYPRYDW